MLSSCVPGFRPSLRGLHFANVFPRQPVVLLPLPGIGTLPIGDASRGLCGGMVFTTLDLFTAGRSPPPVTEPPARESALYRYLVRRLFDSFNLPHGPLKYYHWMNRPDEALWRLTALREWPRVRDRLDRGQLTPLGLVKQRSPNPLKMGENHQVLAYGYDLDTSTTQVRVQVYDPNYPNDDDIWLKFGLLGPVTYSTGSCVRGFFCNRYRGRPTLAAIRTA
jgi:hypothetical protein